MTMNYERRNAVLRTEELLSAIVKGEYEQRYGELLNEARSCIKHYPSAYDMDRAAVQAPEVFGEWDFYKNQEIDDCSEIIEDLSAEIAALEKQVQYWRNKSLHRLTYK